MLLPKTDALLRWIAASHDDGRGSIVAIEEIATLMFLALLDARESHLESGRHRTERSREPAFFPGQAERYRWSRWCTLRGSALYNLVQNQVLPYMASLVTEAPRVAEYFRDARLSIEDPNDLESLVDEIHALDLGTLSANERTEIFDGLLERLDRHHEIYAGTDIQAVMADLVGPGRAILDPACGTGGLLLEAGMRTGAVSPNGGRAPSIDGMERDLHGAHIAMVRLWLAGLSDARVRAVDALSRDGDLFMDGRTYDAVVCHVPFGLRYNRGYTHDRPDDGSLPPTSSGDVLFLALVLRALAPGGVCAILVPQGLLFRRDRAHLAIRQRLLDDFEVLAVIALPAGALQNTGLMSSILVIRRPADPMATGTDRIWFYDLAMGEDDAWRDRLPELRSQWQSYRESGFDATPGDRARDVVPASELSPSYWVATDDVRTAEYHLGAERYRPYAIDPTAHRDPRELMQEVLALEEEIQDTLRSLLARASDVVSAG